MCGHGAGIRDRRLARIVPDDVEGRGETEASGVFIHNRPRTCHPSSVCTSYLEFSQDYGLNNTDVLADTHSMGIYDILRDKSVIRNVNQAFYNKVYDHEWLSLFFQAVTKEHIINQQTDFITTAIGGPKKLFRSAAL